MTIEEYHDFSKEDAFNIKWSEKDWHELVFYTKFLESWSNRLGIEDVPLGKEYCINPKSYCGKYTLESNKTFIVTPNHDKLDERELKYIAEEVVEWSALLGHNILAQLRFTSPIEEGEGILSFSDMLKKLTEIALYEYLPPTIEKEVKVSQQIFGNIDIPRTSRHLSQGETLLVSKKIRLKTEPLPLLLLLRFNYDMILSLNKFLNEMERRIGEERGSEISLSIERLAKRNLSYHRGLLMRRQFSMLLEEALEIDFEDPELIEETLRQASSSQSLRDLTYLWEGYKGGRSLLPLIQKILLGGYTLKPLSKLYELWVLSILTSQLSSMADETLPPEYERAGSMRFQYRRGDVRIELLYNNPHLSNLRKFSNFTWHLRPDYVITVKRGAEPTRIALIGDAKYKQRVDPGDVERMLAYMLSYCWSEKNSEAQGVFMYIGNRDKEIKQKASVRINPDARIYRLCLRPYQTDQVVSKIKDIIQAKI